MTRRARWGLVAGGIVAALALVALVGMQVASRMVKERIVGLLGPEGSVQDIHVGLSSVEILGARIGAPKGWPAKETLSAERVVIVPDIRQLLSDRIRIVSITIEKATLPVVRQQGGIRLLPTLVNRSKESKSESRHVSIGTVHLRDCILDLYDETVHIASGKLRLHGVEGTVKDLSVPELDTRTTIALTALAKGPVHAGKASLDGWTQVSSKNSDLRLRMAGVDIALVEPYVMEKAKAGIDTGTFDLDLDAKVRDKQLDAPGTLTMHELKFKSGGGLSAIPRDIVIGALADKEDTITIHFQLHGPVDKPEFTLEENMMMRFVSSLGKVLGLSVEGLLRAIIIIMRGIGGGLGGVLGG